MVAKSVKPLVFVSESEEVEQPASIITSKEIITHSNSLYGLSDFEIVRFILFPPRIEFYYLRANAGSNFAAFNAGNNPPNNAVSTDTATATTATLIG